MLSSKTYRSRSEAPNYGSPSCFGALPKVMRIFAILVACFYSQALLAQTPPRAPEFTSLDGQEIGGVGGTHDFTGLPLTQGGWTDLGSLIMSAGYADARIVYVSSSQGSDSTAQVYSPTSAAIAGQPLNPGGTIRPYASLSAAYNQLRDGYPDVLLMRRGDTWSSGLGIAKRGRNNAQRMVFAAYGQPSAPRPVVGVVLSTSDSGSRDLILAHYEVRSSSVGDFRGFNVLMEGVSWNYIGSGIPNVGFVAKNSVFRRGAFRGVSVYSGWGSSQGADGFNNGLLEETVHYNSPSATTQGFQHNVYINDNVLNMTSRYNVSAFSPGVGWRQRGLGTVEGIVVLKNRNLTAFDIGSGGAGPAVMSNYLEMRHNMVLHSNSSSALNNVSNAVIEDNIFPGSGWIYQQSFVPMSNIVFQNNIVRNAEVLNPYNNSQPVTGPWLLRGNDFQRPNGGTVLVIPRNGGFRFEASNRYFSSSPNSNWFAGAFSDFVPSTGQAENVSYPDPNRNIITYMNALGASPSGEDQAIEWFMNGVPGNPSLAGMLNNRYGSWDDRFTAQAVINYIRAGFGRPALN